MTSSTDGSPPPSNGPGVPIDAAPPPAPKRAAGSASTPSTDGTGPSAEDPLASASSNAPRATGMIALAPGVRVDLAHDLVELDGVVCIERGFLEQVACSPNTREHEALVAVIARPRDVHAALLLLGLAPGAPGSWTVQDNRLVEQPPTGPAVTVQVRFGAADGAQRIEPVSRWVREVGAGTELAATTWLFAGSVLAPVARTTDDAPAISADRYLADASGSVIGLVTFGDEVLAFPDVHPDSEAVAPLEWEAWTERLPPVGTKVVLILRPHRGGSATSVRSPHYPPS